jgi:predicted metal-dependent hydrolase
MVDDDDELEEGVHSEDEVYEELLGTGVCTAIYDDMAGTEEVVLHDPEGEMQDEASSDAGDRSDDADREGFEDAHNEDAHNEDARSDGSSEASAEEVGLEDPGKVEEIEATDEVSATPKADGTDETSVLPRAPKKKKKKKRKKKRRTLSNVIEEVNLVKRPPVPRFPHPSGIPHPNADFLPVAASTIPMADRSPSVMNMKERVPKHLLLGRFPRRPLASLLGEGLEEGAARAANGEAGGEPGTGEEGGTGGEFTSLAAAESLGLVLESSNSSWTRPPRRSQSHDGAARASRNKGAADDTGDDEAGLHGSKAGGERGRSTAVASNESKRRHRARSEAPHGGIDEASNGLSIVGVQPKANKNKLSVASKQWLSAVQTEQRKREQESIDAAIGALYFSFSSMKDADGKKIVLQKREKVVRTLHELNTKVAIPLCRHFGIRFNFFSEHHCQAKKAGVTVKEPLVLKKQQEDGTVTEETRHLVTIRLRIRVHPTKGDPQTQFISRGTQLAVLLHEMAHLKHMNHGKDFMLFLRDVFAQAVKIGVFDPAEMTNEIPSPWPWENEIFKRGGDVSNEELLALFMEHKAAQREKARAAGEESARKAAADAVTEAVAVDLGLPHQKIEEAAPSEDVAPVLGDRAAAATPSDPPSPFLPPASPEPEEGEKSGETEAVAIAEVLQDAAPAPAPPPVASEGAEALRPQKQKPKAFFGAPVETLKLASAYTQGARAACEVDCECCEKPSDLAEFGVPTTMEYGDIGDSLEFDTSTEIPSPPLAGASPRRRSRSNSRGRARSESVSRNSSVAKLPQIAASSGYPSPPRSDIAARSQRSHGIPTLPPIV